MFTIIHVVILCYNKESAEQSAPKNTYHIWRLYLWYYDVPTDYIFDVLFFIELRINSSWVKAHSLL